VRGVARGETSVTEHDQPTNADDIAVAEKTPTGTEVLRAAVPGQMTGVGLKVAAIGAVLAIGAYLTMAPLTKATFPFVRTVALLVLFAAVAGVAVFFRGLVWLVQGLVAYVRAPR
jgi:hypothetical protein